jgi:hypothetical protein
MLGEIPACKAFPENNTSHQIFTDEIFLSKCYANRTGLVILV